MPGDRYEARTDLTANGHHEQNQKSINHNTAECQTATAAAAADRQPFCCKQN